jgi:hypothetical protein
VVARAGSQFADEMFEKEAAHPRTDQRRLNHGCYPPHNVENGGSLRAGAGLSESDNAACRTNLCGQDRCQSRQESLQIGPASIPVDQPVNGSRVAQIVKPRLPARPTLALDSDHQTQSTKGSFHDLMVGPTAVAKAENRTVRIG